MKKIIVILCVLILTMLSVSTVFAQSGRQANILRADAGEDRSIKVGSEIIFDGSASYIPQDIIPRYVWDMGNGDFRFGLRPIYSYERPGVYRVKLKIEAKDRESFTVDEVIVEVFEQQAVVIARSQDITRNALNGVLRTIQDSNIAVAEAYIDESYPSEVYERTVLMNRLLSLRNVMKKSDMIVVIDRFGAETLLEYIQTFPEDVDNKKIAYILTAGSLTAPSIDMGQLVFNNAHAKEVRMEYLSDLPESFFYNVVDTEITFLTLERGQRPHSGFFDIFYQLNSRLLELGMTMDVLYFLYLLFFINIFSIALRKVLGISVVGIQTLTLSLISIFVLGVIISTFIFSLFFIFYYLIRRVTQTSATNLFPSQFMNVSIFILVSIVGVFVIQNFFPFLPVNIGLLLSFIVLSISANRLSISVLSDSFNGLFLKYAQEILFFFFNAVLFSFEFIRMSILMYPELYLFIVLIAAVGIERYRGLRLSEYIRFHSILHEKEEE